MLTFPSGAACETRQAASGKQNGPEIRLMQWLILLLTPTVFLHTLSEAGLSCQSA